MTPPVCGGGNNSPDNRRHGNKKDKVDKAHKVGPLVKLKHQAPSVMMPMDRVPPSL